MTPEAARSQWLEVLQRHWRDPIRPMSKGYWSSLDILSADELRDIQSEKLRAVVRYAYECIPFYRRKFERVGLNPSDVRSVDDIGLIPLTTKSEMAEDAAASPPWGTFTATDDDGWKERGWQLFATSGTTAVPRVFRYTRLDRDLWAWIDARAMWAMGLTPGRDSVLIASGYGPHVWLWGKHYGLNLMQIPIIPAGGLDGRTRALLIDRYKPTALACTPSYALHLALVMGEMGLDPAATSIRLLLCGGEPGFSIPATRRRLERTWNAELHECYGCTEAAPAPGGFTCHHIAGAKDGPASTHLMPDTHVWETVDPDTLKVVPEGQRGISVVTNLCSEASPQLRFVVGDFTVLTREACPCGRTGPRALGGFVGRADDMLKVHGVTVFPSAIEDAVRSIEELGEYQIVVRQERELDFLLIQVEVKPGVSAERWDAITQNLETGVTSRCLVRPTVELVPSGTIPRTEFKARRVRDLRATPKSN
jgi:phenylacetate-CoA ligase